MHPACRKRKHLVHRATASDDDDCAELGCDFHPAWQNRDDARKADNKKCASEPGMPEDEGIPDLTKHTPREVKAIMSKRVMDAFKRGDDDLCRQKIRALNSLMLAGYFRLRHDWGA